MELDLVDTFTESLFNLVFIAKLAIVTDTRYQTPIKPQFHSNLS